MANEIDHIAELQKRLYARNPESLPKRKFGILRPLKQTVRSNWGDTEIDNEIPKKKRRTPGYKRFFIFSFFFFLIALGGLAFSFYRGALTLSSKNVDLVVLGSSFVSGGESLPIQVEVINKNSTDLIGAVLVIDYPKGATDALGSEVVRIEKNLGTIASGKSRSEEFSVVLYGEEGASRTITATLTYTLAGSSSKFQKEKSFSTLISSSPLALTIDAPSAISANQGFTLSLKNVFNGEATLSNVLVRVEYPNGFVFGSAIPAPVSGDNVWKLGDLQKGSENTISIKGKVLGEIGDQKAFRVYVGVPENTTDNKIAVTYSSALHTATLAQPFIASEIFINGTTNDIAAIPIGTPVTGIVRWSNTSGMRIANPVFTLVLSGEGIDLTSVAAQSGYFDALNRTLTWNAQSNNTLAVIGPGATGQLEFSFNTVTARSIADAALALSVAGTFPDNGYAQQSISNVDQTTIKYASHLQFASQSLYSVGSITNTGPFPPKVGQDTTYTITWTARPSENALSSYTASAMLPLGVVWNSVVSPQEERVSYNPETRVVTWDLGVLPKATSVPQSRSVSFQVKVKPTAQQTGLELPLLQETTVSATDSVAGVPVTLTRPSISTRLSGDPAFGPNKEKVLP